MSLPYANIHYFDYDPQTNNVCLDEDNEPMFGFYFELIDGDGAALCGLMGPYSTKAEVEEAAHKEWANNTTYKA